MHDFLICTFLHESFIDDLKKFVNKPQIICRKKFSAIPQSSLCLDQNTKSQKTFIYVHMIDTNI